MLCSPSNTARRVPMSPQVMFPAKRFVVSSVSSDAHMWNLVFLQLLLAEQGAQVTNLGACVPDDLIIEECRRSRPDALVISTVSGFDAVFEADGGIDAFQDFLGSLDSAERPALEPARAAA